ncbi:hypothetical protein [Aneurinibacillus aneurinilyticus]|uniref:Uncharacterized protein n=1 Tax=Aneurinibacillus aneurinilyticus ATCC 12856 TaxID=649747 RepID=U1YAR5_ANEAE|nr:hypothetical protein [Aneurinibacillus aneurinilyticus]ERI07886.1 hypothetical protein HMPREF0083_04030 [Aneurinibacillus aneurinilyticus ATCC 12856]MED0705797.1 hypothetical protein [Aneurinibacillus aneurinilyticus]MED0722881.1 hypothetical protein [Aneurinibacillus aneurinilyticus]MED0734795.1 hypothetical protein [Aneurinibacillus aneurinilyticus]MED0743736.1 hypothetical protein [Aneurinibacillus aneurinilyticus]
MLFCFLKKEGNAYVHFYRRRLFPVKRLPLDRRQRKYVLRKIESEREKIQLRWNRLFGGRKEDSLDEQEKFIKEKFRSELTSLRVLFDRLESDDVEEKDLSQIHSVVFQENKALQSLYT